MNYGMMFSDELQKSAAVAPILIAAGATAAGASALNELYGEPYNVGSRRFTAPLVYGALGGLSAAMGQGGGLTYLVPAAVGAGALGVGAGKLLGADKDAQMQFANMGAMGTLGGAIARKYYGGGIRPMLVGSAIGAGIGSLL